MTGPQLTVTVDLPTDTDHTAPVIVGRAGTQVVVLLDPAHADVLAQILARFEAIAANEGWVSDDTWDPDTWLHTMVDLFREKTLTVGLPDPTYVLGDVPIHPLQHQEVTAP